jgi:hypothetical protein
LTGTFAGALENSGINRCYVFSYSISAANTWEQKSITIAGDTTGTWLTDSGIGISLSFALGVGSSSSGTAGAWGATRLFSATGATSVVGTSGATFYITGVQLEKGLVPTPFEVRSFGTELALCQRYYYKTQASGVSYSMLGTGWNESTTGATAAIPFPVKMRARPTALEQTGTATDYAVLYLTTAAACTAVPLYQNYTNQDRGVVIFTTSAVLTAGNGSACTSNAANNNAFLAWSAEL